MSEVIEIPNTEENVVIQFEGIGKPAVSISPKNLWIAISDYLKQSAIIGTVTV